MPQFEAVLELLLGLGLNFAAQAAISSFVCLLLILEVSFFFSSLRPELKLDQNVTSSFWLKTALVIYFASEPLTWG